MKKFFKYFIIIVLVLASIGGTCFFFFKHLTKRQDSEAFIANYLYSSGKVEFDSNANLLKSNTDDRFTSLIATKSNLDGILSTFSTYLVNAKNYKVNENEIIKRLESYISKQSDVDAMIDSFLIRLSNPNFNPNTGANEIYSQFCKMNVIYADALIFINSELNNLNLNKDADLKFSMIDLYLNVTINTMQDVITNSSGLTAIKNESNLSIMNAFFKLENSILITPSNTTNFESLNNKFINHYNNVNKTIFSQNLASNINLAGSYSEDMTEELKASYYFKAIYRI